jgi:hypothetical protein
MPTLRSNVLYCALLRVLECTLLAHACAFVVSSSFVVISCDARSQPVCLQDSAGLNMLCNTLHTVTAV